MYTVTVRPSALRWRDERNDLDRQGTRALRALAALPPHHPQRAALRTHVIELHLPLARRLARRYHRHDGTETLDDLCQVAAEALIKAVDGFDPRRGEMFVAYAVPTILGELKRYFRDRSWQVRAPRRVQELYLQVRGVADELTHRLGRSPNVAEIASHLGVSEDHVIEAISSSNCRHPRSLNAPVGLTDGCPELADTVGADDADLEGVDARLTVERLLAQLPERERRILTLRFFGNQSQAQIARQIGISQMHVSRLLERTLKQLRHRVYPTTTTAPNPHPGPYVHGSPQ